MVGNCSRCSDKETCETHTDMEKVANSPCFDANHRVWMLKRMEEHGEFCKEFNDD